MISSIDSISLVCNVRRLPPPELLSEQKWSKKRGNLPGTTKWINNGMKDVYEPQLTFYQTWHKYWRLRADLSVPNLINGNNIHLLDDELLAESLEVISNNVTLRSGNPFNAGTTKICRIHYALNFIHKEIPVSTILAYYARYKVPRMLRTTVGYDETVYFGNKSRVLKIYDKPAEVAAKHGKKSLLFKEAEDIVRIEYSLPDETAVKRFADRKHIADTTAKTMCSRESINIVIDEISELLRWDSIDVNQQQRIKTIFNRTQNMNLAQRLEGFLEAEGIYGKNFYLDKSLDMSKSTYDRNRRECRRIGF